MSFIPPGSGVAPNTTSNLSASTAQQFLWTPRLNRLLLVHNISMGATIYVLVGTGTASATNYTFKVDTATDGQWTGKFNTISLFCSNAGTYGTNFRLEGQ